MIGWKMMGEGEYVVGMEPSNCLTGGRANERANGTLREIEPGEIDVEALRDAFTEYFAPMIDEQVKSALKPYVALGHNNPFKHMPTTTAGYLKVVRYLKQFEL